MKRSEVKVPRRYRSGCTEGAYRNGYMAGYRDMALMEAGIMACIGRSPPAASGTENAMLAIVPMIGPALRRVTDFTGYLDTDGLPYLHRDGAPEGGDLLCISSICPDECFHPGSGDPPCHRFHFDVTAVPVAKASEKNTEGR